MIDIDKRILDEYEAMQNCILPSERRKHAENLVKLEAEREKGMPRWEECAREDGE